MSHALSRLRGLFADDLFVRTPTSMEPTARAREIAPLITAAIEHIEAALHLGVGFDPATSTGDLYRRHGRIRRDCAGRAACRGRLPGDAPSATLRLLPATGHEAIEQLDRGEIDVAVAHLRTCRRISKSTVLLRDPFVVVARKGHPIAGPTVSLEAYAAQNHVLVSPRGDTRARSTAFSSISG